MKRIRHPKRLNNNRKGSIEGLPLQLMIVILVATMGTGILLGWMNSIDTPNSIGSVDVVSSDIDMNGEYRINDGHIEIFVTDQDGNPLKGATVVLSGLGVCDKNGGTAYGTTDSTGYISFSDLSITMRGSTVGFITVNVSMSDYGENTSARIAVIA